VCLTKPYLQKEQTPDQNSGEGGGEREREITEERRAAARPRPSKMLPFDQRYFPSLQPFWKYSSERNGKREVWGGEKTDKDAQREMIKNTPKPTQTPKGRKGIG
jgi:hypothetical protein